MTQQTQALQAADVECPLSLTLSKGSKLPHFNPSLWCGFVLFLLPVLLGRGAF